LLVVSPPFARSIDVALLSPLRSTGEQQDQSASIAPEVDPVFRSRVDPSLGQATNE
jgi:hypothetical protein